MEALDKNKLRSKLRAERARQFCPLAGALCIKNILDSPAWEKARAVACYYPLKGEINTEGLMAAAWENGKHVLLPRIIDPTLRLMSFHCHAPGATLFPGPFGLREPSRDCLCLRPDLYLIPGLAFDRLGYRLGYGGGYYDRYFAMRKDDPTPRIGLCLQAQVLDSLPHDTHDLPMTALCTESGLFDAPI